MKATIILVVLAILCVDCQPQTELIAISEVTDLHKYKQLELFPIAGNAAFLAHHRSAGNFLTLAEAIQQDRAVVHERGGNGTTSPGAEVSRLIVENKSGDSLLILAGELVTGGFQDRTIARDVVVPPHSGEFDLSVFCVEQNRWAGGDVAFSVNAESMAPSNVRRAAVEHASQDKVWDAVGVFLQVNEIASPTNSVAAPQIPVALLKAEYTNALSSLRNQSDVIGVIAVADGQIIGCDLFMNHELFSKYFPNLIQSYATESIGRPGTRTADQKVIEDYFNKIVLEKARTTGFLHEKPHTGKRVYHLTTF